MAVKILGFLILIALIILLMIVVKKLAPIIKINREAFKKAREEIRKAADAEDKAEADAEKAKVEAEDKAEADAEKAKAEEYKAEAVTAPISNIASELAAAIALLDGKEADLAEAIAKAIAEEKVEAERKAKAKRKAFEDEVAKASTSIVSVLNTPLDQFQPTTKPTARTVVKIEKKGGDQ